MSSKRYTRNIVKPNVCKTMDRATELHFEKLAYDHCHYTQDIVKLDWLVKYPYIEIPEDDKIKLMNAKVSAQLKLTMTIDEIGDMLPRLRMPVARLRSISDDLDVTRLYEHYYVLYIKTEQYLLDGALATFGESKKKLVYMQLANKSAPRFVNKREAERQTNEKLRDVVIELARHSDGHFDLILQRLQDVSRSAEYLGGRKQMFAKRRSMMYQNREEIDHLMKRIDVSLVAIQSLGDARVPLPCLEMFEKQMQELQSLSGYTLQEWYKKHLKIPVKREKQK